MTENFKGMERIILWGILGNFLFYKLQLFKFFGDNGFRSSAAVCKGVFIPYILKGSTCSQHGCWTYSSGRTDRANHKTKTKRSLLSDLLYIVYGAL